jgi:metallo-beta-lactamase family protein
MKIKFFGAAKCVTGSCFMVESKDTKFIVDCGMRQGADVKKVVGNGEFPFNPSEVDFAILTHAHIDHSGYIPLLVKKGFEGEIITTSATSELCSIMLPDSGHIQEMDVLWKNKKRLRKGKKPLEPLYSVEDAYASLKHFKGVEYGDMTQIGENVRIRFRDAGHVLGSSSVEIWVSEDGSEEKMVFSGDIGNNDKPIIKDPTYFDEADYVIMESTYGNRFHRETKDPADQLRFAFRDAIKRGGNVVIPAFAVGRTQETLYDISKFLEDGSVPGLEKMPVYIDSPLGIKATNIFEKCYLNYYDKEALALRDEGIDFFSFSTLNVAQSPDESKAINFLEKPAIIISSSGMCDAGRIKHHLKHNLWKENATIIFVGYQAVGTLGRSILDGAKSVKIFGERILVKAKIQRIEGFSGHADKAGLLKWIEEFDVKPKKVFIAHGEEQVAMGFGQELKEMGYNIEVPSLGEVYDTKDKASYKTAYQVVSTRKKTEHDDEYKRAMSIIKNFMSANDPKSKAVLSRKDFLKDVEAFVDKWEIKE